MVFKAEPQLQTCTICTGRSCKSIYHVAAMLKCRGFRNVEMSRPRLGWQGAAS